MKLIKGRWHKFSNRVLPRYIRRHYQVYEGEGISVAFNNFESAKIFEELIRLKRNMGVKQNG